MRRGTIVGSYQLLKQTGQTSYSEIFAARRVGAQRLYEAHALRSSPESVRRALTEVLRTGEDESGVHLAEPPALLTHAGRIVLVSTNDPSESLDTLFGARVKWPPYLAVALVARIARTLDCAAIRPHGDLCADNIHIRYDTKSVEIRQAGIALAVASASGATQVPAGSIAFLAPERIRDPSRADARTDVYGLGLVLYELLTGRRAIVGSDPDKLLAAARNPRIVPPCAAGLEAASAKLEKIVLTATASSPSARHQTLGRLAYALDGYLASRRPSFDVAVELRRFVDEQLAERGRMRSEEVGRLIRLRVQVSRASSASLPRRAPRRATTPARASSSARTTPPPERASSSARATTPIPRRSFGAIGSTPLDPALARPLTPSSLPAEVRPFTDASLAEPGPPAIFGPEGATDDLARDTGPLIVPTTRPPLAPIVRLLFLASLLVVAITVALVHVANGDGEAVFEWWRSFVAPLFADASFVSGP